MLTLLKRIKVVKDLIIHKLDNILLQLENVNSAANSSLQNEVSTLQAAIHLVETLKRVEEGSEQSTSKLSNKIVALYEDVLKLSQKIEPLSQKVLELPQETSLLADKTDAVLQEVDLVSNQISPLSEQIGFLLQQVHSLMEEVPLLSQKLNVLLQQVELFHQQSDARYRHEVSLLQNLEYLQQEVRLIISSYKQSSVTAPTDQYLLLNPEVGLMTHLYSYLPSRSVIDVGANRGDVSEYLLQGGYDVYAFEPFLPVFNNLCQRLKDFPNFHAYNFAIGSEDRVQDLYLATDFSDSGVYGNTDLYSSLIPHSFPEDLKFTDTVQVEVKTLSGLHQSSKLPPDIGLLKIDTEGADLEVIRGMGEHRYPVVSTEFWDEEHPFGRSASSNKLKDLVLTMKGLGYYWFIVIYRTKLHDISFYCNYPKSLRDSWGNVFFFQTYEIFAQALKWCSATLPQTYFNSCHSSDSNQ